MMDKYIYLVFGTILVLIFSSFVVANLSLSENQNEEISLSFIQPNGEFSYKITGNETKWVKRIWMKDGRVKIYDKSEEDRTYEECVEYNDDSYCVEYEGEKCLKYREDLFSCKTYQNITYQVPTSLPVKINKLSTIKETLTKTTTPTSNGRGYFDYQIQQDEEEIKLGESSIIIIEDVSAGDVVNILCEPDYCHLNTSDQTPYFKEGSDGGLGSELLPSGAWTVDGDWVDNGDAAISWLDDTGNFDTQIAFKSVSTTEGKTYRVTFTVNTYEDFDGSTFTVRLNGGGGFAAITSTGSKSHDLIAGTVGNLRFEADDSGTQGAFDEIDITGISIKEVIGAVAEKNVVAYYPFDVDNRDFTKNNNDGTNVGQATIGEGLYNNSLILDGGGDYVSVPADTSINMIGKTELTVTVWMKPLTKGVFGQGRVLDKGLTNGYDINIDSDGDMNALVWMSPTFARTSTQGQDCFTLGEWNFFAFTFNEDGTNNIKIYCDGVLNTNLSRNQSGVGSISNDAGTGMRIGQFNGVDRAWNGSIDEVMIFDNALNSTEISDIFNNQSDRHKNSGTLDINQNISVDNNQINISSIIRNLLGSKINVTIDFFSGLIWDTNNEEVEVANGVNHTFNISLSTENVSINYTLFAGDNNFYTPILFDNITLETFEIVKDEVINCSKSFIFTEEVSYPANLSFFNTGSGIHINTNWSFENARHSVIGEAGCTINILKGTIWN